MNVIARVAVTIIGIILLRVVTQLYTNSKLVTAISVAFVKFRLYFFRILVCIPQLIVI